MPRERPAQAPSTDSMSSDSDRTQADSGERPQARPAHCMTHIFSLSICRRALINR